MKILAFIFLHRKMNFSALFFPLVLLFFLFSSCDHSRLFEENKTLERSRWNKNEQLRFSVVVKDTTSHYNIFFNIRNEGNYPYSNLYLFSNVSSPAGVSITDTLDIALADSHGKWYGSGLGDLYFLQVSYKSDIRFPLTGVYTFNVSQGMRVNVLEGIRNFGIRVEKVKTENSGKKK
ncbi:MAG: gliding motility lipoprotein GldH [Chlorobi bacterium]|nr:gliding motility lipoprotein GldH [Chlorobiota bacterium]